MKRSTMVALSRSRRGSTILIVLGLLSILILLAATLAFTTRVEVTSAKNFATNVQNRVASVTGVAASAKSLGSSLPEGPLGVAQLKGIALNNKSSGLQSADTKLTSVAGVEYRDASARLNLNTATADQLEALIRRVTTDATAESTINPSAIAEAIVRWRLGPDGQPGTSADDDRSERTNLKATWERESKQTSTAKSTTRSSSRDTSALCTVPDDAKSLEKVLLEADNDPTEYVVDIRLPAFGDDRRFTCAEDLATVPGVTKELAKALEPYVTAFSISRQQWQDSDGAYQTALDLNRASAEEIREALVKLYGDAKNQNLLRQFAVNIVDSRDSDNVPTSLPTEDGTGTVLGFERTPVLSEIYADSLTVDEDGDDGQFAEIYNPWSESVSLSGWRLEVGSSVYPLQGQLPARGYLIVTDDYDNSKDEGSQDELNGQGSFYDLFGRVANGSTNRILELSTFSLPHSVGSHRVRLKDEDGNVIDEFNYQVTASSSPSNSFQRRNALVRDNTESSPTPFSLARPDTESQQVAERLRQLPLDRAYVTPLELFDTFAGFPGSAQSRWAFPALASLKSTQSDAIEIATDDLLLDARVIDLFCIEVNERRDSDSIKAARSDSDGDGSYDRAPDAWRGEVAESNAAANRTLTWVRWAEPPVGTRQGRVNINTASAAVLSAVGFSKTQVAYIDAQRQSALAKAIATGDASVSAVWKSPSDILADDGLWPSSLDRCERLKAFETLFGSLSVGSLAFLVEGQGFDPAGSSEIRLAGVRYEGLLAFDQERPQPVTWRFAR